MFFFSTELWNSHRNCSDKHCLVESKRPYCTQQKQEDQKCTRKHWAKYLHTLSILRYFWWEIILNRNWIFYHFVTLPDDNILGDEHGGVRHDQYWTWGVIVSGSIDFRKRWSSREWTGTLNSKLVWICHLAKNRSKICVVFFPTVRNRNVISRHYMFYCRLLLYITVIYIYVKYIIVHNVKYIVHTQNV